MGFSQVETLMGSIVALLIEGWILYVSKKVYDLLQQNIDSPEVLTQKYQNAPCKCI